MWTRAETAYDDAASPPDLVRRSTDKPVTCAYVPSHRRRHDETAVRKVTAWSRSDEKRTGSLDSAGTAAAHSCLRDSDHIARAPRTPS